MTDTVRRALADTPLIRHPCDLDLLLFFSRHPRTIAGIEQIAGWLGYDQKRTSESLDRLLRAGVLSRTQPDGCGARLYVFSEAESAGGRLSTVLELAATRAGRLELVAVLSECAVHPVERLPDDAGGSAGAKPYVVRRSSAKGAKAG